MPKFGPTFWSEVEAAGLLGLPFSIEGDELVVSPSFPADKRAALDVVVAAHDPRKQLPQPRGLAEVLVQAMVDEGIIPANKTFGILNRVKGK